MASVREILQSVPPLFPEHITEPQHLAAESESELDELLLASVEQEIIPKARPRSFLRALAAVFEKPTAPSRAEPYVSGSLAASLEPEVDSIVPMYPETVENEAVGELTTDDTIEAPLGPVSLPSLPDMPPFVVVPEPVVEAEPAKPAKRKPRAKTVSRQTKAKPSAKGKHPKISKRATKASSAPAAVTVAEMLPPLDELERQLNDHRDQIGRVDSEIGGLDREIDELQRALVNTGLELSASRATLRQLLAVRHAHSSFVGKLTATRS